MHALPSFSRDKNMKSAGKLYIVATPIGNLRDITQRALDVLQQVDLIVCEDTRHSKRLLNHYCINKPSISLHAFNEKEKLNLLLDKLQAGLNLALVSDAGTPLISDPGFVLVQHTKLNNIEVVPIPGPCAAIAALSASGIPSDHFIFYGFLPAKSGERIKELEALKNTSYSLIFYEAPHRLLVSLLDLMTVFGEQRLAAIAKELTKIHETILLDELKNLYRFFVSHEAVLRGEFVIIVSGAETNSPVTDIDRTISILLKAGLANKQVAEIASQLTGQAKNLLYKRALQLKNKTTNEDA